MSGALSREARDALPEDAFAVPGKRRLPITDVRHAKMAWSQIENISGLTDSERTDARLNIVAKAHDLGVETISVDVNDLCIDAMSIELPDSGEHTNRMPFSGVLVKLDQPSDDAPHGSDRKRVLMTTDAAEKSLASLLGMGVNAKKSFDGHDAQRKIGVITGATIDGSDLRIEGIIYAADFPEEAATIKRDMNALGFSFEAKPAHVVSLDGDPLVITSCVFTGASILRKDKAAYTTTSLAAAAAGENEMTKEDLEAIGSMLDAKIAPLSDKISTIEASQAEIGTKIEAGAEMQAKVKPHADKLRAAADGMEAAGVGTDTTRGHVPVLRRMADMMEASAMAGHMPHAYSNYGGDMYAGADKGAGTDADALKTAIEAATKPFKDELDSLKTKLADGISASREASPAPERKTLPPVISALMAKADVSAPNDGEKLPMATVDKIFAGANLTPAKRIEMKAELARAGLID